MLHSFENRLRGGMCIEQKLEHQNAALKRIT